MDIMSYKKTITETTQDLAKLEVYAKDLEMEGTQLTLQELNERIKSDRFNLAVLGEFRRGKSTLINALLRMPVLPSDIVPTTASVNRITYDAQAHAKVEYLDGSSHEIPVAELTDYATQEGDKSSGVREVTVWYPTVYCSNNVDIYDTPGLNDSPEMTAATTEVIAKMDVAIFTLSAGVNFSMSECEFIGEKLLTSSVGRIIFVVTHMGQYTPEQQTKILSSIRKRIEGMVLAKAEEVLSDKPQELEEFRRKLGELLIFGVDSVKALEARRNHDLALLEESGFIAFEQAIDELLTRDRGRVMLEKQTGAILKSATDIFNVIQTRMGPLTMDEAEFLEKCEHAEKQLSGIQETLENEMNRLDEASDAIKQKTREEWNGYVDEIKAKIGEITHQTDISMKDLTPKGRKRVCMETWENQMIPAISHCLQVYSEKIQNDVSEAIGKECEKLESYQEQITRQMDEFAELFVPKDSVKNTTFGQIFSFWSLGLAGALGYKKAGVKGALVGGLSGMAATFSTSFVLGFIAAACGLTVTTPVVLAITLIAGGVSVFTGKKVTDRLLWKESAERLRQDMEKLACEQLDRMLIDINFTQQIDDYISEIFNSIKKEVSATTTASMNDMQKALISTRENFAAEKAQIAQKVDDYTAILESLSAITERTVTVRKAYGLDQ